MDKTLLTRKTRLSDKSIIGKHSFLSGLTLSLLSSQIYDLWLPKPGTLAVREDIAGPAEQMPDPTKQPVAPNSQCSFSATHWWKEEERELGRGRDCLNCLLQKVWMWRAGKSPNAFWSAWLRLSSGNVKFWFIAMQRAFVNVLLFLQPESGKGESTFLWVGKWNTRKNAVSP